MLYLKYLLKSKKYIDASLNVITSIEDEVMKDIYDKIIIYTRLFRIPKKYKDDVSLIVNNTTDPKMILLHRNLLIPKHEFKDVKYANKKYIKTKNCDSLYESLYKSKFITLAVLNYYEITSKDPNDLKDLISKSFNYMYTNDTLMYHICPITFYVLCYNIDRNTSFDLFYETEMKRTIYNKYDSQYRFKLNQIYQLINNL